MNSSNDTFAKHAAQTVSSYKQALLTTLAPVAASLYGSDFSTLLWGAAAAGTAAFIAKAEVDRYILNDFKDSTIKPLDENLNLRVAADSDFLGRARYVAGRVTSFDDNSPHFSEPA